MASAWGAAWGKAWGNAWGALAKTASAITQAGWEQYQFLNRHRQAKEVEEERKRLGILEEKLQDTEAEKTSLKRSKPRKGTERHVQKWLYLALLEEELTRLKFEEAALQARIIELLESIQRIEEEEAIIGLMMGLAA